MEMLKCLRKHCFWFVDFCKGSLINKHLLDVEHILSNPNDPEIQEIRHKYLQNILIHAATTTTFYNRDITNISLDDFPIIQKHIVQDNFQAFKSSKYLKKKNYKVATSGSTGTPFFLFHDKNKKNRTKAEAIYFLKASGYEVGDTLFYFRLWAGEVKGKMLSILQNVIKIDVSNQSSDNIENVINQIKTTKGTKYFLGISSSFEALCKHLDYTHASPIQCNAKAFIANSDALNDYTKKAIKHYFNAPIISRYSNEEQGLLSQQKLNSGNDFYINWASFYVEIIKLDSNDKANEGELGRIVVTDLFNYCMPLIRYDTGDLGAFGYNDDGELILTKVEGRILDCIYNTREELISSYSIYPIMQPYYDKIKQYQFIQVNKQNYIIKIVPIQPIFYEQEILSNFKKILGDDACIALEAVTEIPLLPSAKFKKVMNLGFSTNIYA